MRELKIQNAIERYLLIEYPLHLGDVIRESPRRNSCKWYEADGGIRFQPWQLSLENTAIARMNEVERGHFAVALCWTTLIDQSMYSDSQHEYQRFRKVTWFPKQVGSCKSACRSHQEPSDALRIVGSRDGMRGMVPRARSAFLAESLPVVTSIVERLAESQRLHSLPEVFRNSLKYLDLGNALLLEQLPIGLSTCGVRHWAMPRISEEMLQRGHPPRYRARTLDQQLQLPRRYV